MRGLELVAGVRADKRRKRERRERDERVEAIIYEALQVAYRQGIAVGFEAGARLVQRDEEPS